MGDMDLESLFHGGVDVVLAGGFGEEDVDGEGTTRDGETGGVVVELGELRWSKEGKGVSGWEKGVKRERQRAHLGSVHRSGGDDELKVSTARENCTEKRWLF
jgi:hypothetical protein